MDGDTLKIACLIDLVLMTNNNSVYGSFTTTQCYLLSSVMALFHNPINMMTAGGH